jgi:hypothetical protein
MPADLDGLLRPNGKFIDFYTMKKNDKTTKTRRADTQRGNASFALIIKQSIPAKT